MRIIFLCAVLLATLAQAQTLIPSEGTWIDDLSGWSVGTSTCGELGTIVGGYGIASTIAIEKEFSLPDASCKARIQMDFVKIDSWDNEYAYVYINDELIWQGGPYIHNVGEAICGISHLEQVFPIDIMSTPSSNFLKISVRTNLNEGPTNESFGIQNIRITAQDCPVIPSEGTWIDDLSGWSVGTSTCGALGTMVGGYGIASTIAIEKEFILPDASCKARIQMDFVKLDSWDNEYAYVYINDELIWQGGPYGQTGEAICGLSTLDQVFSIDIMSTESSKYLKISVSTNLNEGPTNESFGIQNIRITAQDCSALLVDCVGSWSTCIADCVKTYTITTDANQFGTACPSANGETNVCAREEDACPADCVASDVNAISGESCFCGASATAACDVGKFCYDDTCRSSAKYDPCVVNQYDITTKTCGCEATEVCHVGQHCYDAGCHADAQCHKPETHDPFYGAKLHAQWFPSSTHMQMSLPLPSYITLDKITFKDAQNPTTLQYTRADVGLWEMHVGDSKPCIKDYTLEVDQDTFFGSGSRFTLTGKQMRTVLKVDALDTAIVTHNGHTYTSPRHIRNSLPLLVNLVPATRITCDFKITYSETQPRKAHEGPCFAVVLMLDPTAVDEDTLLAECQATYGNKHGLTCVSVEANSEGLTQVNFAGEQDDKDAAVEEIENNGWNTASTGLIDGTSYCPPLEPEEFIIFLDAYDDVGDDDMKTITLELQVHSRGCIDHAGDDVFVQADSLEYIKDGSTTFVWDTNDAAEIIQDHFDNLCVETVTWTFEPAEYSSGPYDVTINLEFDLQEALPSFTAAANIRLEEATDVLEEVGFVDEIAMYEDPAVTIETDTFNVAQKFYAKITLSNLVVETDDITCTSMTIIQTDEFGVETATNMMDPEYNFIQIEKATHGMANVAICGAELESPHFHISLDGWDSVLIIDLIIDYVQGEQQDVRLRRKLGDFYDFEEIALADSEDAFYANSKREPDQKSVAMNFNIVPESKVGSFADSIVASRGYAGLFLLTGVTMAGFSVYMNKLRIEKINENTHLLEEF